ncbi:MAG: malonyl-CoA decarboxylase family protein [Alphaproteobacteria bacterium]|nr:malonyl-CoA decarboxylase family protein [Alphaproteobacteria bacterium]
MDIDRVIAAAERVKSGESAAMAALKDSVEPPRQELFRRINAAPRGTARLVKMRRNLLRLLRADKSLSPIDSDLRHLLRSWFNRGFLVPERIDWNSSATILEKIIAYEAVHAIDTWDALRERLAPPDRRCFAFFHPAMPDEPLIFVEVALTRGLATSIQSVLQTPRDALKAEDADTAIFYSISNCQAGLAGVSFGAFLIKQVASDLKAELPNLRTFATLSPVPGFSKWVAERGIAQEALTFDSEQMRAAAATYLARAKGRGGRPRDPVARFHLGNGAALHQINVDADLSAKGVAQSHGVMVNYLYELDLVESRHEAFVEKGELALSKPIETALERCRSDHEHNRFKEA